MGAGRSVVAERTDEARPRATSRAERLLPVLLIAVGIATRIWILSTAIGRTDSDEAVVGLMARAFLHGHISAFFWGQNYGGSGEAALVAMVFAITGSTVLSMKLVAVALSAVGSVLVWRIGRRTMDEPRARFAGALFWVFPPAFVWASTKERGFYELGLVLVLGAILLALRVEERLRIGPRGVGRDVVGLGFVAGVAVWTSPQSLYVLAPTALWLAWRTRGRWPQLRVAVPAAIVGAAPWLLYVAAHGRSALEQPSIGTPYPSRVKNFFTDLVPRAFGGKVPYASRWIGGALGEVVFVIALAAFAAGMYRLIRNAGERRALEPLLFTAACYPFLASVPRLSALTVEPRYGLLLAPIAVLLIAAITPTPTARLVVAAGAVIATVVFIASMLTWVDQHPTNEDVGPPSLTALEQLLDSHHIDRVYADYWIGYRLTLATRERIVASPVLTVRRGAFAAQVAAEPNSVYAVYRHDVYDTQLGATLRRDGIAYERFVRGRYAIYVLDGAFAPDRFARIWPLSP